MNAADRCVSLFGGTEGRKEGGRKGGSLFAWNCSRGGTGYLGRVSKLGAEMRPSLFAPRHPVSDRGDLESTKCWAVFGRLKLGQGENWPAVNWLTWRDVRRFPSFQSRRGKRFRGEEMKSNFDLD